jgi:hypothetical protein
VRHENGNRPTDSQRISVCSSAYSKRRECVDHVASASGGDLESADNPKGKAANPSMGELGHETGRTAAAADAATIGCRPIGGRS